MVLADTNIWLALSLSGHEYHQVARNWFAKQALSTHVMFCRSTEQSFLRLLTTNAVMRLFGQPPLTNDQAIGLYQGFRSQKRITFANEPTGIASGWHKLARRDSASPKLWMDAYLAAFAITGKHQLITIDRGFKQFSNLDLILLEK